MIHCVCPWMLPPNVIYPFILPIVLKLHLVKALSLLQIGKGGHREIQYVALDFHIIDY